MSRWRLLAAWSLVPCVAGCGASVRAGLANGPKLGSTGDEGIHDVIANGEDGCATGGGQGPLRHRVPPCPAAARASGPASWTPSASGGPPEGGLVVPWLKHFYVGWPCATPAESRTAARVAWAFTPVASTACGLEE
ncbi:MAG TPA: hypothetical protein VKU41_16890 [Polyangiaceae bacterium]|nr:hypothetical protein [Polyangiaceae bacterium]